jgi:NADPH:quinone reductase-like Zn-dependent oxidoreductase
MRAYLFDSFDSLDELRVREETDPRPQRGEVLVRVQHAVSLNFGDIAMLRGRYPRRCVPDEPEARPGSMPGGSWQ